MEGRVTYLGFEAWIDFMFGREVRSDYYPYFEDRDAYWDPNPATRVAYMTRLFEDPVSALAKFSDRQIGATLWLLPSEDAHCIYSPDVAIEARERFIASIATLFSDLFEPHCAPVLGHLDQAGAGPLNPACYMWWENLPFVAAPNDPDRQRLEAAVVQTMDRILRLSNPACQESALHGLGHLSRHASGVDAVIAAYLDLGKMPPELAAYACAARTGCIL